MKRIKLLMIASLAVLLAGCGSMGQKGVGLGAAYTPVIDGVKDDQYHIDLSQCRDIAIEVQKSRSSEALNNMLAGALIGAAIGDNGQAALIGGAAGAASSTGGILSGPKAIIRNCMVGRGYNVLL